MRKTLRIAVLALLPVAIVGAASPRTLAQAVSFCCGWPAPTCPGSPNCPVTLK